MSFALPTAAREGAQARVLDLGTNQASAGLGGSARLPFDLRALTAEAFGYSPLRRYQVPAASPAGGQDYTMFGLPVFAQLDLHTVTNPVTQVTAYGMRLLDPILTVGAPMTVVKTPVAGRRGTVKEYISQGDYAVTVRAILATDLNAADRFAYPLPQVKKLRALCELGVALPCSGWLLDVYGIKNLVVENVSYESLPGFVNLQAYEIQCVSDEPIELAL